MDITVKVNGISGVLSRFLAADAGVRKAVGRWAYSAGQEILSLADRNVPIDTGALHNSHYVTMPRESGSFVGVEVGYGGPAAPYAAAVHETNKNYKRGSWKFLEKGRDEYAPNAQDDLTREVARELGALRG